MDLKTTSLDLSRLRHLTHCIRRWSSGRLLQHIDIDSRQKPELVIALEATLEQVRRDYQQNTEFSLWEFIADFHRGQDYGDPGEMSKWLNVNAFVPKLAFRAENVSPDGQDTIDCDAMIPQTLPPPQSVSSDASGHVIASLALESQPQLRIHPLAHSPGKCFSNDVLTGKLSAKSKARLQYNPSPYYQCLMALTQPEYGHQSKKDLPLVLKLEISPNLSQLLRNNPRYKIMLFCASNEVPNSQCMAMEFPDNSHIHVNNQRLDWSPQGVKNKPGTFSPADITRLCKLQETATNHVELRYANASKMFHASLHLVCPTDAITTINALIKDKFVTKESTYRSLKKKIKDDDIMELSSTLSLKCPLSVQRIEVPCRSFKCTHLQCFDAFTFLSINERVHRWICPVCNRKMDSWDEIIVDGYYTDILESTPKGLENVNVSPDGKWDVPVNRVPLDIDRSVPMLSDSELSSPETNSNEPGNEPIYVIDDDDEENSQSGASSDHDNEIQGSTRVDSGMEVEEVVVHSAGSKEEDTPTERQETSANSSQQPATMAVPPASSPSRFESSVTLRPNSQSVPRESHFMDLTLYPSVDVIDLTTDSELEDNDETL
ncbi:SUMO ligase siz1 [Linnemannia exigua]|uniref:SUMO ligase siz1 n=1 Tax=Linnemannia exigua TaxID=604196 RepID=A0AAD4DD31_9FUNG|nr:SUMO ligase siz1 [Linnemannia exigua]